jgi:putative selenium metabolism hydrolase
LNALTLLTPELEHDLIEFTRALVRIQSLSGQEGEIIRFIEQKMNALGFDEVTVDGMGNLLGRIGSGERSILFDSHVDTVVVNDGDAWQHPPFGGDVADGLLWGRGSVYMKSGAAASIYAAVAARQAGLADGKAVYVSCTVFEEDCDGENLKHLFKELAFRPRYVVICEPSCNQIVLGHNGKAQITIKTHGVSAHGAAPEKGVNAVYEMAEIIQRVDQTNRGLMREGRHGTLVLSRISSVSASLNAVPSECEIYLDRRMAPGETKAGVIREIEQIIAGKQASWAVGALERTSWTGMPIHYEPFHDAWQIELEHPLAQACTAAYRAAFEREPVEFGFWNFSTNAVTPVSLGIPAIGFGPGDEKLAHMRDENCPVEQIVDACRFYAQVIAKV